MPTPLETVTAFLATWSEGREATYTAFREYLAPDAVWENVGMTKTSGVEEAVACFRGLAKMFPYERIEIDMLSVAEQGNKVLTERVDRLLDADGNIVVPFRVMGVFEVVGGQISSWRDYFDSSALAVRKPATRSS